MRVGRRVVRLGELAARVQAGTYEVPAMDVADAILAALSVPSVASDRFDGVAGAAVDTLGQGVDGDHRHQAHCGEDG